MQRLMVIMLLSVILTTIPSMTLPTLANCCSPNNDGDGAIDAADSDCQQRTITLRPGVNQICWATPSPYPNRALFKSPQYVCPEGYVVSYVRVEGVTEKYADFVSIWTDGRRLWRGSGTMNATINLYRYSVQKVQIQFRSDASITHEGVKIKSITCSRAPQSETSPECPSGSVCMSESECQRIGGRCIGNCFFGCCCRVGRRVEWNCCDGVDVIQF